MDTENTLFTPKVKKYMLAGFVAALFAFAIIINIVNSAEYSYKQSPEELANEIDEQKYWLGAEELVNIFVTQNSNYQFIDLRPAEAFEAGHLPGAINIPVGELLDKKHEKTLRSAVKKNVLYHNSTAEASDSWMLLRQLDYPNNYLMQGGYEYVQKHLIDEYSPLSGDYKEEAPKYDFNREINKYADPNAVRPQPQMPKPKPLEKSANQQPAVGGC